MNHQTHQSLRFSRRTTLRALGILGIVGVTRQTNLAAQATPPTNPDHVREVMMPDWRFSLLELIPAYEGDISRPDRIPAGMKIVACQVVLTNLSDQPMEFTVRDIRLRDVEGVEYQAGDVYGDEPRIVSQNLPDGERTRGWVWFAIPEANDPAAVVFIPPRPVLKVVL